MRCARFYRAYYQDPDDGCLVGWFRLKTDAKQWLAEQVAAVQEQDPDDDCQPSGIEPMMVELSTSGFIHFLNRHADSDNG